MTKRRDVIKAVRDEAKRQGLSWTQVREGANHTVFDLDGVKVPVPRHTEIGQRLVEVIYKECAVKLGKDWWKK